MKSCSVSVKAINCMPHHLCENLYIQDQHLWCSYFSCLLIENFANVNDNTDQQRRLKDLPSNRMGTEHFFVDRGRGWAVTCTKQISAQEKCKKKSGHRECRDNKKNLEKWETLLSTLGVPKTLPPPPPPHPQPGSTNGR